MLYVCSTKGSQHRMNLCEPCSGSTLEKSSYPILRSLESPFHNHAPYIQGSVPSFSSKHPVSTHPTHHVQRMANSLHDVIAIYLTPSRNVCHLLHHPHHHKLAAAGQFDRTLCFPPKRIHNPFKLFQNVWLSEAGSSLCCQFICIFSVLPGSCCNAYPTHLFIPCAVFFPSR